MIRDGGGPSRPPDPPVPPSGGSLPPAPGGQTAAAAPSEATGLIAPEITPGPFGRRDKGGGVEGVAPPLTKGAELALLAFAFCVPVSLAAGQTLLALAALLWLAVERGRPYGGYPRWLLIGIALLFAGEWLACIINGALANLGDPLRKHGVLLALPIFAVVARKHPLFYRRTVAVATAAAALVACYAVWQHFTGVDIARDRVLEARGDVFIATGGFSHHLAYGGSTMLALLAAAGLAAGGERWRGLPLALLVPIGFGLLWCYARSSWTGALVGLVALVAARRGRRPLLLTGLAVAAFMLLFAADPSVRARLREGFAMREPPPRLLLLATSLRMLASHPLGIGPGRFADLFPTYKVPGRYLSTVHAHSDPMRAALDGGPLGLAGYLVLVAGSFVAAARALAAMRRDATARGADEPGYRARAARRDLAYIALAVSAAYLVAGLFQTYFWDQEVVALWVLLAAPAMAGTPRPAPLDEGAPGTHG